MPRFDYNSKKLYTMIDRLEIHLPWIQPKMKLVIQEVFNPIQAFLQIVLVSVDQKEVIHIASIHFNP